MLGISSSRRCVLRGEEPTARLDTLQSGSLALVGYRGDEEAGRAHVVLEADRGDGVLPRPVMRQIAFGVAVAVRAQPFAMRFQRLAGGLVVIEHPDLAADELGDPDRRRVSDADE